mmetsp:Transcript_3925/g.9544  ORF Transcript_3925/g.9544 Transcript_3925/m.9544 type:complete len:221 (-) Transcript_3925:1292-1954(-)
MVLMVNNHCTRAQPSFHSTCPASRHLDAIQETLRQWHSFSQSVPDWAKRRCTNFTMPGRAASPRRKSRTKPFSSLLAAGSFSHAGAGTFLHHCCVWLHDLPPTIRKPKMSGGMIQLKHHLPRKLADEGQRVLIGFPGRRGLQSSHPHLLEHGAFLFAEIVHHSDLRLGLLRRRVPRNRKLGEVVSLLKLGQFEEKQVVVPLSRDDAYVARSCVSLQGALH